MAKLLATVVVALLVCSLYSCVLARRSKHNHHSHNTKARLVERDLSPMFAEATRNDLLDVPIVDPPKRIAGYFRLNRTEEARMFYFFFQSRSQKDTDPVVLWMTGGPGCSSELAIFYENGPYTIQDDLSLVETQYGWDVNSNMIFVDQPINTGFSYSDDERDTVHDEIGVGEDMLDFLQEFFEAHPEYASRDFYVTGESYAGHYVPAVSHRVWKAKKDGEGAPINIKGLAIGNGLTDPSIQYGAYGDYALENNLIDKALHDKIQKSYPTCKAAIDLCDGHDSKTECMLALQYCQSSTFQRVMAVNPGINYYDIRKPCTGRLCYDFDNLDKFINLPETREALGVGDRTWEACSAEVYMDMMGDWMKNYDKLLPEMLDDGVHVMIYAGDRDLICNWVGNRRWVDALQWSGSSGWTAAQDFEWSVDGSVAGKVKEYGALTFVQVYNAGHMVPMDQPANGLDMITKFSRGQSFQPPSFDAESEDLPSKVTEQLLAKLRSHGGKGKRERARIGKQPFAKLR